MASKVTILRKYQMNNESYEHTVLKFVFGSPEKEKIESSLGSFLSLHLPGEVVRNEDHSYDLYITGTLLSLFF